MPKMIQKLIDTKISLVTIVGWLLALIGLTASVSSMWGEQKQKLLYLAERQTKIEISLDRLDAGQQAMSNTLARIEAELLIKPASKQKK